MLGHLSGLGYNTKMQESRGHMTIGENQVDERCASDNANNVDDMGAPHANKSTQLQGNKRNENHVHY